MPTSITSSGITFDDATTQATSATKAGGIGTTQLANGAVTPVKLSQPYTLATAKAFNWNGSSSNALIDFESIPSWAKRITVMFNGVSASGTSPFLVQLGDGGGFETTGYESFSTSAASIVSTSSSTAGFQALGGIAARTYRGAMQICLLGSNTWTATCIGNDGTANNTFVSGAKTLSDALTQVRFTTVNGADTFDAGTINISYEG